MRSAPRAHTHTHTVHSDLLCPITDWVMGRMPYYYCLKLLLADVCKHFVFLLASRFSYNTKKCFNCNFIWLIMLKRRSCDHKHYFQRLKNIYTPKMHFFPMHLVAVYSIQTVSLRPWCLFMNRVLSHAKRSKQTFKCRRSSQLFHL